MSIFLKTNVDGFGKEGIGSIAQWNLVLYGICKKLEVDFFGDTVNIFWLEGNLVLTCWRKSRATRALRAG